MSTFVEFNPFQGNPRVVCCDIPPDAQLRFFEAAAGVSTKFLSRRTSRGLLVRKMVEAFGEEACREMRRIVESRDHGALVFRWIERPDVAEIRRVKDWIRAACTLGELMGVVNMSHPQYQPADSLYFVHIPEERFTFAKASGYRPEFLHTDGYAAERLEDHYLILTICRLRNWIGGSSTLLHLDDWEEVEQFRSSPWARTSVRIVSDRRHGTPVSSDEFLGASDDAVDRFEVESSPVFYDRDGGERIRFAGEYMHGLNREHQSWLVDLATSLNKSMRIVRFRLEQGMAVVVNNHFWLHGRDACAVHPDVERLLYRVKGQFGPVHTDPATPEPAARLAGGRV